MPWGAVAGAVVSYGLNSMGGDDKNGGAGAQTQTKAPWAASTPWIMSNMQQGQKLQDQLTAQPFSAQQEQAYNNSYAQSDYMRALVPSLLGQMQNQQVGFDRTGTQSNKQNAWDWAGLTGSGTPTGAGGTGTMQAAALLQAQIDANNKKKPEDDSDFTQQGAINDPMSQYYSVLRMNQSPSDIQSSAGLTSPQDFTGKYGTFKYGDPMPEPGTKAYKDMNDYFAYGGADPMNYYGKAATTGGGGSANSGFMNPNTPAASGLMQNYQNSPFLLGK